MQERDHGTGRLVDDLVDEIEGVLGAHSQPDERDVGPLAYGGGADLGDIHFSSDDLVAEGHDDRGNIGQAIGPFVRDQDAHMLGSLGGHASETINLQAETSKNKLVRHALEGAWT
ncbi:MAG TPA: hypothetical protein VIL96_01925 [Gaiellaceae bacterium]